MINAVQVAEALGNVLRHANVPDIPDHFRVAIFVIDDDRHKAEVTFGHVSNIPLIALRKYLRLFLRKTRKTPPPPVH